MVPWPAGGAECGIVPHKGRVLQTEGGAEEDGAAAARKHQRLHLCSTQVGLDQTHVTTHKIFTLILYLVCLISAVELNYVV